MYGLMYAVLIMAIVFGAIGLFGGAVHALLRAAGRKPNIW